MKTLKLFAALMLLLTIATRGQQNINLLLTEVTLPADSISKSGLLDSLSKQLNIHFSYNPQLLRAGEKIKFSQEKLPLLNVFNQIIDKEVLAFHLLDNQVIFYPIKQEEVKKDSSENSFLILRGSVYDRKEAEPVPFCNIAILGKGLGTMSNNEGNFLIKIPAHHLNDTLRFSCMGFLPYNIPVASAIDTSLSIGLEKSIFQLKAIDIVHYQPAQLLQKFFENIDKNYEEEYILFTTYYRELIQENEEYTDVSEAVLHVLKAPYSTEVKEDLVKFIKGKKSSNVQPFDEIRFKLRGGPYYITKLDVVKNRESFINPDFINLFRYEFEKKTLIAGRETAIISFKPIYNLRDMLFEGLLYFDVETGAVARVEFSYTRQGLKEARRMMIEKEPRDCKAIPTNLSYSVEYSYINGKWILLSAHSLMEIKIIDREKKQKTNFSSISEILVTNIEKGDLQQFSRKDIFRPNEFFTEKITSYDKQFWENYNVIEPEEEMENAIKNFNDHQHIITTKMNEQ